MPSADQYFECNEPHVIFEQFDDETILINLDTGHYYSLDSVGAAVWELINHPLPLGDLVKQLQSHYDAGADQVATAIGEFVALMESEELIRPCATAPSDPPGIDAAPKPESKVFAAPTLAKYDDMAEMLLLDPVHDVDEKGWPEAAPTAQTKAAAQIEDDDVSSWPSVDDET